MHLIKLNGWQRLWMLISVIWLIITVVFFTTTTFPSIENTFIGNDEVLKNLSDKTLEIMVMKGPNTGRFSDLRQVEKLPNGREFSVAAGTSQADIDYIRNDYANVDKKIVNKKRIRFIGLMAVVGIIPCLSIYALGLAIGWVYRGFKTREG